MNIFKRLFRIGKAEAHSAVDKLEDPIKMTEQGIRDLKKDLEESLKALAQVKAQAIRAKNDVEKYTEQATEYENKAVLLLKQVQKGELDSNRADELATEAILRKEENLKTANQSKTNQAKFESNVSKLEGNIKGLKSRIAQYENELKTMKARVTVAEATKNINKQMANIDSDGTVNMLERMKDKVAQEEALAESYGDMALENRSVDEDINDALGDIDRAAASDKLAELKAKLNLDEGTSDDEAS